MSDDNAYKDGDVVWVKLGNVWWPGEVTAVQHEEIIKKLKRKPYCVVKFFQEEGYEYVKNAKQMFPFQCSKKDEFIKKGIALFSAKNKSVENFPSDLEIAQRKMLERTDTIIINDRPDSIVKAILGQTLTRHRSDYYDDGYAHFTTNNSMRRSGDTITKILNISTNRSKDTISVTSPISTAACGAGNTSLNRHFNAMSAAKPRAAASMLASSSSLLTIKSSTPTATTSNNINGSNNANIYRCSLCDFKSVRQNVLILHRKTHSSSGSITKSATTMLSSPLPMTKTLSATNTIKSKILASSFDTSPTLAPSPAKTNFSTHTTKTSADSHELNYSLMQTNSAVAVAPHSQVEPMSILITDPDELPWHTTAKGRKNSAFAALNQPLGTATQHLLMQTSPISLNNDHEITPTSLALTIARLPKKKELAHLAMSKRVLRSSPQVEDITEITLPALTIRSSDGAATPANTIEIERSVLTTDHVNEDDLNTAAEKTDINDVAAVTNSAVAAKKRNSEEIRRSLLADWSDEEKEDEDDINKVSQEAETTAAVPAVAPPASAASTALVTTYAETNATADKITDTTTNTIAPILTTAAPQLTSSNRIRNIPKKDRRDIVLKEFNSEITSSNSSASTTPPIVHNFDSVCSNSSSSDSVVVVEVFPTPAQVAEMQEPIDVDELIADKDPKTILADSETAIDPEVETTVTEVDEEEPISVVATTQTSTVVAATATAASATLSCFDFQDEEDNDSDVLTSIAKFKKKYLSPDKTDKSATEQLQPQHQLKNSSTSALNAKESQKTEAAELLEHKDQQLAADIEMLLEQTAAAPIADATTAIIKANDKEDALVKGLPIKERGKRIFKSRNRSRIEEQPPTVLASTNTENALQEKEFIDEATVSALKQPTNAVSVEAFSIIAMQLNKEIQHEAADNVALDFKEKENETQQSAETIETEMCKKPTITLESNIANGENSQTVILTTEAAENQMPTEEIVSKVADAEVEKNELTMDVINTAESELTYTPKMSQTDNELPIEQQQTEHEHATLVSTVESHLEPIEELHTRVDSPANELIDKTADKPLLQNENSLSEGKDNAASAAGPTESIEPEQRFATPTDENSSVCISETGAEFGSPTSMLDDERLPLLSDVGDGMTPTPTEDALLQINSAVENNEALHVEQLPIENIDKASQFTESTIGEEKQKLELTQESEHELVEDDEIESPPHEEISANEFEDFIEKQVAKTKSTKMKIKEKSETPIKDMFKPAQESDDEINKQKEIEAPVLVMEKRKTRRSKTEINSNNSNSAVNDLESRGKRVTRGSIQQQQQQQNNIQNTSELQKESEKIKGSETFATTTTVAAAAAEVAPKTKTASSRKSRRKTISSVDEPLNATDGMATNEPVATVDEIEKSNDEAVQQEALQKSEEKVISANIKHRRLDSLNESSENAEGTMSPSTEIEDALEETKAPDVAATPSSEVKLTRKRRARMKVTPRRSAKEIAAARTETPTAITAINNENENENPKGDGENDELEVSIEQANKHAKLEIEQTDMSINEPTSILETESEDKEQQHNEEKENFETIKEVIKSFVLADENNTTKETIKSADEENTDVILPTIKEQPDLTAEQNIELNTQLESVEETQEQTEEAIKADVLVEEIIKTNNAILENIAPASTPVAVSEMSQIRLKNSIDGSSEPAVTVAEIDINNGNSNTALDNDDDKTNTTCLEEAINKEDHQLLVTATQTTANAAINIKSRTPSPIEKVHINFDVTNPLSSQIHNILASSDNATQQQEFQQQEQQHEDLLQQDLQQEQKLHEDQQEQQQQHEQLQQEQRQQELQQQQQQQELQQQQKQKEQQQQQQQQSQSQQVTTKKRPPLKTNLPATLKRKKSIEDDIPSFIIERPTTTTVMQATPTGSAAIENISEYQKDSLSHVQNLGPQVKITRKQKMIEVPAAPTVVVEAAVSAAVVAIAPTIATTKHDSDAMFDISNMPILLSNEQLLTDSVQIMLTPAATSPVTVPAVAMKQQQQTMLLNSNNSNSSILSDGPRIIQQQIIQTAHTTTTQKQQQQLTPQQRRQRKLSLAGSNLNTKRSSAQRTELLQSETQTLTAHQKHLQEQQQLLQLQKQQQQQAGNGTIATPNKQIGIDSRGNKYVIIKQPPSDLVVQQAPLQHLQQHNLVSQTKSQNASFSLGAGLAMRSVSESKSSSPTTITPPITPQEQQQQIGIQPLASQPAQTQSKPKSPAAAATGGRKHAGNTITLPSSINVKQQQQKFTDNLTNALQFDYTSQHQPQQQAETIHSKSFSKHSLQKSVTAPRRNAKSTSQHHLQRKLSLTIERQSDMGGVGMNADTAAIINRRLSSTFDFLPSPAKIPKLSLTANSSAAVAAGGIISDNVTLAQQQLLQLQQQQRQRRRIKEESPPPLHHLHSRKSRKVSQQYRDLQKKGSAAAATSGTISPASEITALQQQTQSQQELLQQQQAAAALALNQQQQQAQTQQLPSHLPAATTTATGTPQQQQNAHSTTVSDELMQIQSEDQIEGTSKILAVPTQPIPGYNETFLLCTLVNNNYKPIDNVPLYLDHDLNQLVPVPEAIDGQANLIVNHPPAEDGLNNQMHMAAQQQQQQQQQLQQQHVLATANALKSVEPDSSTQFICLQPIVENSDVAAAAAAMVQQPLNHESIDEANNTNAASQMVFIPPEGDDSGEMVANNAVILNIEGQQIIIDAATFAQLLANPDGNTQLITDDGTEFVLTREVLAALEAHHEAQNAEAAEQQQQQQQQQHIQQQLQAAQQIADAGASDILAVALAGSDLYTNDVLEIETSQGLQGLMGTDGSIVFQPPAMPPPHLTPPITAHTSETNALLNQTPIMSTLEKPSTTMLGKRKAAELVGVGAKLAGLTVGNAALLATGIADDLPVMGRPNLEDSLAVIGVTAHNSVPTSLELPITITNPAIAPKMTMATSPTDIVQFQPHRSVAAIANEARIYNDPGS